MQLLKNYGLSLVLTILFLSSWTAQGYFQWEEFREEQIAHSQPVAVPKFVHPFLAATFENWQSEFLQLLAFVVLTSLLVHKGSPESKDSDEKMQRTLDRLEKKINELAKR